MVTIHQPEVTSRLQTFDLPVSTDYVEYISDEVTAVCPITGQPDQYTVKIHLHGSKVGLESKALKMYLQSFRNEGVFCEKFADVIACDVMEATEAAHVSVHIRQKPRGGIAIEASSTVWQTSMKMARCDDGESDPIQDVQVRGSTPPAEPLGEVP